MTPVGSNQLDLAEVTFIGQLAHGLQQVIIIGRKGGECSRLLLLKVYSMDHQQQHSLRVC